MHRCLLAKFPRKCLSIYSFNSYNSALNSYTRSLNSYNRSLTPINCFSTNKHVLSTTVKSYTEDEILDLVPHKGLVSIVDDSGKFHENVPLRRFIAEENLVEKEKKLIVVELHASDNPAVDSKVTCKIINTKKPPKQFVKSKDKKKKSIKANMNVTRPVDISWTIGDKDLQGQKRSAIESILVRKQNKLQLTLMSKRKSEEELTPMEIEQRELLVKKCTALVEEYGEIVSKTGSVNSIMTFELAPRR